MWGNPEMQVEAVWVASAVRWLGHMGDEQWHLARDIGRGPEFRTARRSLGPGEESFLACNCLRHA
jgi:hypothetical protein